MLHDSAESVLHTAGTDDTTLLSRRRPGRRADVHPALIPLLRGTTGIDIGDPDIPETATATAIESVRDDLNPSRGVVFGLILSVPIWLIISAGAYWLLR